MGGCKILNEPWSMPVTHKTLRPLFDERRDVPLSLSYL